MNLNEVPTIIRKFPNCPEIISSLKSWCCTILGIFKRKNLFNVRYWRKRKITIYQSLYKILYANITFSSNVNVISIMKDGISIVERLICIIKIINATLSYLYYSPNVNISITQNTEKEWNILSHKKARKKYTAKNSLHQDYRIYLCKYFYSENQSCFHKVSSFLNWFFFVL